MATKPGGEIGKEEARKIIYGLKNGIRVKADRPGYIARIGWAYYFVSSWVIISLLIGVLIKFGMFISGEYYLFDGLFRFTIGVILGFLIAVPVKIFVRNRFVDFTVIGAAFGIILISDIYFMYAIVEYTASNPVVDFIAAGQTLQLYFPRILPIGICGGLILALSMGPVFKARRPFREIYFDRNPQGRIDYLLFYIKLALFHFGFNGILRNEPGPYFDSDDPRSPSLSGRQKPTMTNRLIISVIVSAYFICCGFSYLITSFFWSTVYPFIILIIAVLGVVFILWTVSGFYIMRDDLSLLPKALESPEELSELGIALLIKMLSLWKIEPLPEKNTEAASEPQDRDSSVGGRSKDRSTSEDLNISAGSDGNRSVSGLEWGLGITSILLVIYYTYIFITAVKIDVMALLLFVIFIWGSFIGKTIGVIAETPKGISDITALRLNTYTKRMLSTFTFLIPYIILIGLGIGFTYFQNADQKLTLYYLGILMVSSAIFGAVFTLIGHKFPLKFAIPVAMLLIAIILSYLIILLQNDLSSAAYTVIRPYRTAGYRNFIHVLLSGAALGLLFASVLLSISGYHMYVKNLDPIRYKSDLRLLDTLSFTVPFVLLISLFMGVIAGRDLRISGPHTDDYIRQLNNLINTDQTALTVIAIMALIYWWVLVGIIIGKMRRKKRTDIEIIRESTGRSRMYDIPVDYHGEIDFFTVDSESLTRIYIKYITAKLSGSNGDKRKEDSGGDAAGKSAEGPETEGEVSSATESLPEFSDKGDFEDEFRKFAEAMRKETGL